MTSQVLIIIILFYIPDTANVQTLNEPCVSTSTVREQSPVHPEVLDSCQEISGMFPNLSSH